MFYSSRLFGNLYFSAKFVWAKGIEIVLHCVDTSILLNISVADIILNENINSLPGKVNSIYIEKSLICSVFSWICGWHMNAHFSIFCTATSVGVTESDSK